uniref:Cytochrome c oxidase subunit 3 n=1 Tax=Ogataea polymorpha TaxID=460523 RepID=S5TMI7_9ASCO|nr:cytochrome c oxidase subunit 3 [Ogataea polymorpha]AGS44035.1 cytochrome c oxidase subunit 3 [Ogataea polymorpha]
MTIKNRQNFQLFPFHLVSFSPWPLLISLSLMSLALTLGLTMHNYIGNVYWLILSLIIVLSTIFLWTRDIVIEGTYLGDHTIAVRRGLNIGFILFVISEILIFASLFWAYFHSAMGPTIELGATWPPVGIQSIKPTELPLLNTIILLASGASVTWAHHAILYKDRKGTLFGLLLTTILIVVFVLCQVLEYTFATFTIADSVYGSVFYAATGLHFIHMVMLALMLIICYFRMFFYHFTNTHHLNLETTILYLHILDIIWLFLYIVFYWWGS